jgi:hypothetical protein
MPHSAWQAYKLDGQKDISERLAYMTDRHTRQRYIYTREARRSYSIDKHIPHADFVFSIAEQRAGIAEQQAKIADATSNLNSAEDMFKNFQALATTNSCTVSRLVTALFLNLSEKEVVPHFMP